MLSHSVADQAGAAKEAPRSRVYRWSSGRQPKTRPSAASLCMKNGLCGHRNLLPTTGTLPAAQFHQFISTPVPASRTHKTIRPAAGGQVLSTSLFGGELRLKFAQGFGKRRASHPITLPLGFAVQTG